MTSSKRTLDLEASTDVEMNHFIRCIQLALDFIKEDESKNKEANDISVENDNNEENDDEEVKNDAPSSAPASGHAGNGVTSQETGNRNIPLAAMDQPSN